MKLYFKSEEKINGIIEINKLGIKFRNISDNEIDELTNFFKNDIATKTMMDKIKYYIDNIYKKEPNFNNEVEVINFENYNNWLKSIPDNLKEIYWHLLNKRIKEKNFSKQTVKKNISNIIVIEIEETIFTRFYPKEYAHYFLSRLAKFTCFLCSDKSFVEDKESIQYLLDASDINMDNPLVISELFLEKDYKIIAIDFKYLTYISELLNTRDQYDCLHMVSIVDALFDKMSIENDLINKVGLIERLIIKEKDNIEKQFILKVGIILKNSRFKNIKNIDKILKTIYNVRSYLVHGNEKKLFEQLKEIGESVGVVELTKNKYNNKIKVLVGVKIFLDMFLKEVLICYITNNDFCEYLKDN